MSYSHSISAEAAVRDDRPRSVLETDVLVVGGGAAGVAAAHTAARQGLKVLILERYGFCGGGAVAGMSGTICGLYLAHEDKTHAPERLVHGFVDQFIDAMDKRNGLTPPVRYGQTFTRVHEPQAWRESAEGLLAEQNVAVLYHAIVTDVLLDGNERVAGVVAYTKQGKLEVRAKITIDASGDADLAAMAGMATTVGIEGRVQNPTMIFRLAGVDVERFLQEYGEDSILPDRITKLITGLNADGVYKLPRAKVFLFPTPRPNELICNCTRVVGADGRELNPLIARDLSEAEYEGRKQVREYERFFKDYLVGCEAAYLNDTGVQVGTRQTRQIVGVQTLTNDDVVQGNKRRDGIARSPWPIELHSGQKPRLSWLFEDYYEIPYECFVPRQGESLLFAGRCLSAEHEAMASARVTAQCFSYGHAIGYAAALAINESIAVRDIKGEDIRLLLNRDGAQLGA
ncbi:FAD-dependent oxidoreductase [Pollutimonas bauzanensis]|uniref:FAD dependent oxidoreductase n=1 Tax=Pollutimonas bauzanensis TaxID=658167 RepID=A0A1M5SCL6_9BURK|nr:FAD-dependent oxidoreductase [Pollutimonas bauzanensis]SHH36274.1 FAD dependent oxidoreductase [Pollutimonas bauzanensis]